MVELVVSIFGGDLWQHLLERKLNWSNVKSGLDIIFGCAYLLYF